MRCSKDGAVVPEKVSDKVPGKVPDPIVRELGCVDYVDTLARMRAFTDARHELTPDEFWVLEHQPVFTLGQAGKREHVLVNSDIPLVQSDRGGQVTYHGPGQLVIYLMIDIRRQGSGVRSLVDGIENAVIELLSDYGITGAARREAPGVYVDGRKIAALGLRVRRGCSYHGLSLNVDMDLSPFSMINPCGYQGLEVTQLRDLGVAEPLSGVASGLINHLGSRFGYPSLSMATA